jgi:Fur family ferric uptake transcriptional regulator
VSHKHTGSAWAEHARTVLAGAGHHRGAAREELIDVLARQDCALSALELEQELRAESASRRVGRASVYRALELLREHELITRLDLGDGIARYETADPGGEHHHHLLCGRCGQLVPFHDPALERSIHRLSDRLGFDTTGHEVTLRGACAECQDQRSLSR